MLALTACRQGGDSVLIVGRKRSGGEAAISVAEGPFGGVMTRALERLNRATLSRLDAAAEDSRFELSRVTVGLKLEAELGFDEVAEVAGEGAFELRFERLPEQTED